VTRRRLYLETMQSVLGNNRKVYAGDGGNVLYLPLNGATSGASSSQPMPTLLPPVSGTTTTPAVEREGARPARPDTRPSRTLREETR